MKDRLSFLDRRDPPSGKRAPVSNAVHLIQDRYTRVTRTQEICVQGVNRAFDSRAIGDGSPSGDQGLCSDLAAEHPKALLRRAEPSIEVNLQRFEIEEFQEFYERGRHHSIMA
jgi:hypothetical protein